jgi:hypothetical protein
VASRVVQYVVVLGPGHPVWTKLYVALASLAKACGGGFAFVIDEGNGLWCVGIRDVAPTASTPNEDLAADRFFRAEVEPRMPTMRQGVRFEAYSVEGEDRYAAQSFAGIYAVVVWFDVSFEPALVRARIRRALAEIEALTLALPPSDGPGADEGAVKMRA